MLDQSGDRPLPDSVGGLGAPSHLATNARLATASFAVAGACSYVVLVVVGRWLSASGFAVFAAFWSAAFFVAGSTQSPLEQEVARSRSEGTGRGLDTSGTVRFIIRRSMVLVVGSCVVVVAGWAPLTRDLFDGSIGVLGASCAVFAGEACTAMVRGLAAGQGDFRRFAVVVAGQGLIRASAVGILAVVGVRSVAWYAGAIALGNLPAVLSSGPLRRTVRAGRSVPADQAVGRHVGYLVLAAPFMALFTIGVPAVAKALATDGEKPAVGSLLAALSLTSAPLFLFTALQSSILPHFTELATSGDTGGFRRLLRRLSLAVAALGVVGTVGAALLGQWLLTLLFGSDKHIERWQMAALAMTTALMMASVAVAPALLALKRHAAVAASWAAGAVAFAVVAALTRGLMTRCTAAMTIGAFVVATCMTFSILRASRRAVQQPAPSSVAST